MSFKFSLAVKNARANVVETTVGTSAIMEIRSGSPPADPDTAATGTVLATLSLPSDWLAAAASGVKAKSGTWQDASADATGTAGWFRIYASDGTTGHIDGNVTATGGGGAMTVDSTSFTTGQSFTVTGFQWTESN